MALGSWGLKALDRVIFSLARIRRMLPRVFLQFAIATLLACPLHAQVVADGEVLVRIETGLGSIEKGETPIARQTLLAAVTITRMSRIQ